MTKILLSKFFNFKIFSSIFSSDPETTPEMRAVFYAFGPAFKKNLKIKRFFNVNICPLIAEILGLKITEPIDGDLKVLEKTLK